MSNSETEVAARGSTMDRRQKVNRIWKARNKVALWVAVAACFPILFPLLCLAAAFGLLFIFPLGCAVLLLLFVRRVLSCLGYNNHPTALEAAQVHSQYEESESENVDLDASVAGSIQISGPKCSQEATFWEQDGLTDQLGHLREIGENENLYDSCVAPQIGIQTREELSASLRGTLVEGECESQFEKARSSLEAKLLRWEDLVSTPENVLIASLSQPCPFPDEGSHAQRLQVEILDYTDLHDVKVEPDKKKPEVTESRIMSFDDADWSDKSDKPERPFNSVRSRHSEEPSESAQLEYLQDRASETSNEALEICEENASKVLEGQASDVHPEGCRDTAPRINERRPKNQEMEEDKPLDHFSVHCAADWFRRRGKEKIEDDGNLHNAADVSRRPKASQPGERRVSVRESLSILKEQVSGISKKKMSNEENQTSEGEDMVLQDSGEISTKMCALDMEHAPGLKEGILMEFPMSPGTPILPEPPASLPAVDEQCHDADVGGQPIEEDDPEPYHPGFHSKYGSVLTDALDHGTQTASSIPERRGSLWFSQGESDSEVIYSTGREIDSMEMVKIQHDISIIKRILGLEGDLPATLIDQIKALYDFTGVEPAPFLEGNDFLKARKALDLLKSLIGVK